MRTFAISYDLARPQKNKHALATAIMSLGQAWARPLDNTWYVRAAASKDQICAQLAPLLEPEDGLVLHDIGDKVAALNTSVRWFKRRLAEEDTGNVILFPHPDQAAAA
jgi:hypothetical protein